MPRGRPPASPVRKNLIEILYHLRGAYGYELFRYYRELFPKTTMRNVYYHLKKGVALGELAIKEIKTEQGNYSWGSQVEKIYYQLGPQATPKIDLRLKRSIERIKQSK